MAEIKISELSIGDWVCHTFYEDNLQIKRIDGESERLLVEKGLMSVSCHLDHFEPIPITPEILEKNGLEYEDDGNDAVILLCCDMFWARLCVGDTFWQVGIHNEDRLDAVVCNVKHTHQLQHALRLAGVGKEIEV